MVIQGFQHWINFGQCPTFYPWDAGNYSVINDEVNKNLGVKNLWEFTSTFLDAFILWHLKEYEFSIALFFVIKQRMLEGTSCFSKEILMQVF